MLNKKERIKEARRNSKPIQKPKKTGGCFWSTPANPQDMGLYTKTKRGKKK